DARHVSVGASARPANTGGLNGEALGNVTSCPSILSMDAPLGHGRVNRCSSDSAAASAGQRQQAIRTRRTRIASLTPGERSGKAARGFRVFQSVLAAADTNIFV